MFSKILKNNLGLALPVLVAAGIGLLTTCAFAAAEPSINSVLLNDVSTPVTVAASSSITTKINVTVPSGKTWKSTSWAIGSSGNFGAQTWNCVSPDTANYTAGGPYEETFSITAPGGDGTYNLYIRLYKDNDNCSGGGKIDAWDGEHSDDPGYHIITVATADPVPAVVTNVTSSTGNGYRKLGEAVSIQVTFGKAVTVSGTPLLHLETGDVDHNATYATGSGTTTLNFNYTVLAGDESGDLDYKDTLSLDPNGGTITRGSGATAANLTLPSPGAEFSLGFNKALVVDGIKPTVTINQQLTQADPTNALPILFDVVFSEPVSGFETNDFGFSGTLPQDKITRSVYNPSADGKNWVLQITGVSAGQYGTIVPTLAADKATDAAGNKNTVATYTDHTVNYPSNPVVTVNQHSGEDAQADPTTTLPIKFDVVFGKAVKTTTETAGDFTVADINQTGTATGITWTRTDSGDHMHFLLEATAVDVRGTLIPTISADKVQSVTGNFWNLASTSTDNDVWYTQVIGSRRRPDPPSVSLSLPSGGETLAAGDGYWITWQSAGEGVVSSRVSLSTDGGATYPTVIVDDLVAGMYNWTVPVVATTQASVKVEVKLSDGSVGASAVSNNFTITAPAGAPSSIEQPGGGAGEPGGVGGSTFDGSMSRDGANGQLPVNYPVDSLVKLPNDGNPATTADSTVYYLGLDAKRHPFPSSAIFLSWYADYSQVLSIDAATLAGIDLGEPIMVRPGTHWVKIVSDPKTYVVEPGNKLRWIQDEATALALGGADWNANILDIDPSLFTYFVNGADLTAAGVAGGDWPAGSLVKTTDAGVSTYYMTSDARRPFTGTGFEGNMFQNRFIETTAPGASWAAKPIGSAVSMFDNALFSLMH